MATTPDAYLAALSPEQRATLEKVRTAIRAAAPRAEEGMSYGMPAFIQGRPVAGYGASAKHCAFYPMSGTVISTLAEDLAGYDTSKGAIRFPIGKPPPATLVRKLVKARLAEIAAAKTPAANTRPATRDGAAKRGIVAKATQTNPEVVSFLRTLEHPLKKEVAAVRTAILGANPHIREGIKWNAPSFRTEKDYFATIHLRSFDEVQVVLHRGAKARRNEQPLEIADPHGLLKWLGKDRALMKLGAGRTVTANRAALEAIVRAWVELV